MRKVLAVAFLNFKQGIRERLFFGAIFFFAFFLAVCALLGKLSPGESEKVLRNAGLAGIELSGLVLLVFGLVFNFYRERDSRILEIYLSNFSHAQYLSGKLIGYLLICVFYIFLAGLGFALILFLFQAFLWQVAVALYSIFLKLSIVISAGLVFCSLFSSSIIALLCSLSLYIASEVAYPALQIMSLKTAKIQIVLFKCLYYLLPNMDKLDIKDAVVYGKLPPLGFLFSISLYSLLYILLLCLIARFIFIKKEH